MKSAINNYSETLSKQLPKAPELEKAIIGGLLTDLYTAQIAFSRLQPDDFTVYKPVYEAAKRVYNRNHDVDMVSVESELKDTENPNLALELPDLLRSFGGRTEYYIQILKEKSIKRNSIIIQGQQIINQAYEVDSDPFDLLDKLNHLSNEATKNYGSTALTPQEIIERTENEPDSQQLITGVRKWDNIYFEKGGSRRGQIEYVEAITGHGKTEFLSYRAGLYLNKGYKGLWCQREDSDLSTVELLSQHVDRSAPEFNNIRITDDIRFIEQIEAEARHAKLNYGLDFLVVDYIQRVHAHGYKPAQRTQEMEHISQALTDLAIDLDIYVMVASQITRDRSRKGWNAEPNLWDMKQSSQLEQDAFVVTSVFRPFMLPELQAGKDRVKWFDHKELDPNLQPSESVVIRQRKIRKQKLLIGYIHMIHTPNHGLQLYQN